MNYVGPSMNFLHRQETFREVLAELRAQYPEINAYTLVGKLSEVKKFENLSNDLKSFLVRESILFVGSASKKIEDLAAVLEKQDQQIRSGCNQTHMSPLISDKYYQFFCWLGHLKMSVYYPTSHE